MPDDCLSFETVVGALQEGTGHRVWASRTTLYSTMAGKGEGLADHLLARGQLIIF